MKQTFSSSYDMDYSTQCIGSAVIAHFIQYKLLHTEFLEHSALFQINLFVYYILL